MIKPKAKAKPPSQTQRVDLLEEEIDRYRHSVDAKLRLLESRMSDISNVGREIISILPRVKEIVAEQEAATLRTRVEDDKWFSHILDVKIAAINTAIASIKDKIREIDRVVTRLQMRKRKKKS